jgi:hypothetical protein
MNKFFFAATVAASLLGAGAIAQADQGIPVMPALPVVSQTAPGVMTGAMPQFNSIPTPVIAARAATNSYGENAPTFAIPTSDGASGVAYAQIGRIQGLGVPEPTNTALAFVAQHQTPRG